MSTESAAAAAFEPSPAPGLKLAIIVAMDYPHLAEDAEGLRRTLPRASAQVYYHELSLLETTNSQAWGASCRSLHVSIVTRYKRYRHSLQTPHIECDTHDRMEASCGVFHLAMYTYNIHLLVKVPNVLQENIASE